MIRVGLVQVRNADDAMAEHEFACMKTRLAGLPIKWTRRNAVLEPATQHWLEDVDAFVIGGSGDYSVHHPDSARFVHPLRDMLEAGLSHDVPGFLVCFGHQLLGLHLGAEIRTSAAHTEIGTGSFSCSAASFGDPVFGSLPATFTAQTGHSDHVVDVPDQVQVMASNELLHCQAFRVRDRRMWSAQFHPDLTGQEARERYLQYSDQFSHDERTAREQRALAFKLDPCDGAALLRAFVQHVLDTTPS